jgi:hypothetical protein
MRTTKEVRAASDTKTIARLYRKDPEEFVKEISNTPIKQKPHLLEEVFDILGDDTYNDKPISSEDIEKLEDMLTNETGYDSIEPTILFDIGKRCILTYSGLDFIERFKDVCANRGPYKNVRVSLQSIDFLKSNLKDEMMDKHQPSISLGMLLEIERFERYGFEPGLYYDLENVQEFCVVQVHKVLRNLANKMLDDISKRRNNDDLDPIDDLLEEFDYSVRKYLNILLPDELSDKRDKYVEDLQDVRAEVREALEKAREGQVDTEDDIPKSVAYHRAAKEYHELCRIIDKQPHKSITFGQLKKINERLANSLNSRPEFKKAFGSSTKPFTSQDIREFEKTLPQDEFEVVKDMWNSSTQRSVGIQKNAQLVLCVVASPKIIQEMKDKKCYELFHNHQFPSHPHKGGPNQLGWIRVELNRKENYLLVDEVQSDYQEITKDYISRKPKEYTEDGEKFKEVVSDLRASTHNQVSHRISILEFVRDLGIEAPAEAFFQEPLTEENIVKVARKYLELMYTIKLHNYETYRARMSDKEKTDEKRAMALESIMQQFPHIAAQVVTMFAKANGYKHIYWHTLEGGKELKPGSNPPVAIYTSVPEENYFQVSMDKPFGLDETFYKREARMILTAAHKLLAQKSLSC